MILSPVFLIFVPLTIKKIMASVTLKLSSVRNKDNGKSEVLLRYRNTRTIALRAHTHVYVLPKFFQDGEIVIKNRLMTKEVQEAQEAKATLDRIVNHVLDKGTGKAIEDFTLDWAQDVIDRLLYPENYKDSASDELFFQDKTADFLKFKKISYERHKSYRCIFDIVQRFELYTGKPINMNKATGDTLVSLEKFFKDEHTFFEPKKEKYRTILVPTKKYKFVWDNSHHERAPQKRSDNAIITYMSAVRAYWLWCIDMGYTQNNPFRKYTVGSQKYGTPYYLTAEERDQLFKTDLSANKEVALARDIFIFQCYIGCRISDLMSFTRDNIVESENGTAIQYIPSKTKEENPRVVKVYLAPTAIEIMNRNQGKSAKGLFPFVSTGKLNDLIRIAMKQAGITRVVTIVNPVTKQSEQHPICDVASSHMARRTFIGNLYKKVKDPNLVGKLSGHCEGSKAFARYRDIDDDMIKEMTNLLD